ncbi:Rpn family recombination-promoting nuclease/putative transposase [uncultured Cetobacterium sp.]|uniref:Rpn family recombination-promoting nuclease/putative transposase n=1 Tax=uncultured Cetobacterium sp. TaxID=527638 RepID=UPI0025FF4151|nr:Rpn family recombination-promoting nuclease/putative transposase [uncultured Cetobacterium sp.]
MCTSLLDPKMDFIFKSIFGNEKEKSVLLSFLNSAIKSESPLVDVELRNVEITKEAIEDKNSRLDVKAVANDGTIINVEIQLRNEYNMPKRTLYYWSKLYSEQLKEGENYLNLNRTICINILNFIQFKETQNYHSVFKIIEEKENIVLNKDLEIHFLELPKLVEFRVDDPLSGWGMFLKEPSSDIVEEAEETVKEIKLAKKKLYVISSDEDEREKYRMREKARLDAASALATAELKGKAEGERLAKLSIAKSLLGIIPNELIAEKTGLSIEEIELLKY